LNDKKSWEVPSQMIFEIFGKLYIAKKCALAEVKMDIPVSQPTLVMSKRNYSAGVLCCYWLSCNPKLTVKDHTGASKR
jgi:hypothetical protein